MDIISTECVWLICLSSFGGGTFGILFFILCYKVVFNANFLSRVPPPSSSGGNESPIPLEPIVAHPEVDEPPPYAEAVNYPPPAYSE